MLSLINSSLNKGRLATFTFRGIHPFPINASYPNKSIWLDKGDNCTDKLLPNEQKSINFNDI